jgi:hypothetical protein
MPYTSMRAAVRWGMHSRQREKSCVKKDSAWQARAAAKAHHSLVGDRFPKARKRAMSCANIESSRRVAFRLDDTRV